MKITIAGGSGFLGNALRTHFESSGHGILILTRRPKRMSEIVWDAMNTGDWCDAIDGSDVLINLTGKSVDCRYTKANKKEIYDSRINSTNVLHRFLAKAKTPPKIWINASSATTYIHAETQEMDEEAGIIGDDFSMNICKSWEAAFFAKAYTSTRQIATRTSIVLGNGGGAFPKLKRITKLGLGGKQGRGTQFISWIHVTDFCRAIEFIIENEALKGAVNITSLHPIRNSDFMKDMRTQFKLPFGINQSTALLEIGAAMVGTETELLLKSRNVIPRKLISNGFSFNFPTLNSALGHLKTSS